MTNFAIDENLLKQAHEVSGEQTEAETMNLALKELVRIRKMQEVFELFGTIDYDDDYDYKKAR